MKWTLLAVLLPVLAFAQPAPTQPTQPSEPVKVVAGPSGITVTPTAPAPATVLPKTNLPPPISPDDVGVGGFFGLIVDAAKGGNWKLAVVLALVMLVWATRKFGGMIPGPLGDGIKSDAGGVIVAFLWAFLGTVGAGLIAGAPLDFGLLSGALLLGFGSMGGWVALKKLLPAKWREKLGWIFGEKAPAP